MVVEDLQRLVQVEEEVLGLQEDLLHLLQQEQEEMVLQTVFQVVQ
jgi:hypothetical protein